MTLAIARSLLLLALFALAACSSERTLTKEEREQQLTIYTETAQQYYQMGELNRAASQAIKGLELDPDSSKLRLILGWTMLRRGTTEDVLRAEKTFRSVLTSDDFRAPLGLAQALERKGNALDEAAANVRSGRRITEAPDPIVRADELVRDARAAWTESLQWYAKTLEMHADDADAINGAMRVEALIGNDTRSLELAEHLLDVTEGDLDFWRQRMLKPDLSAEDEHQFRDMVEQVETLRVATHLHAAMLLLDKKELTAAKSHLDRALEIDAERSELYARRAQVEKELGLHSDAIRDIERFIALSSADPKHPDIQRAWRLRRDCEAALAVRGQ